MIVLVVSHLPVISLRTRPRRYGLQIPHTFPRKLPRQRLAEDRRHDRLADISVGAVDLVDAQGAPECRANWRGGHGMETAVDLVKEREAQLGAGGGWAPPANSASHLNTPTCT